MNAGAWIDVSVPVRDAAEIVAHEPPPGERLLLKTRSSGEYELCCLPLRIVGADGAPARALLRRSE